MKMLEPLFAVLILLLCATAQAAETFSQFSETWMTARTLGESAAWVLDRDGELFRWSYDGSTPQAICALPVTTDAMFLDYQKPYPYLPAENRAQIDETVNLLAEDGDTLYGINKFAGRIGTITERGIVWHASMEPNHILTGEGWERVAEDHLVMAHQLYLLLDFYDEDANALHHTRLVQIDLQTGASRLYDAVEAYRICAFNGMILMLCENEAGHYLLRFDPTDGTAEELPVRAVAGEALAYDAAADTIYISTAESIFASVKGAAFTKLAVSPAQYVYGSGIITRNGRYAFFGSGIWAVDTSSTTEGGQLTVRLISADPQLQTLFVKSFPEIQLNWQQDEEMTAADVAEAIRSGDTETAVFSVAVDGNFGNLVKKGYAAPMTDPDIIDSVNRMYPALAAPLRNASGEIVAYPWTFGLSAWEVN